MVDTVRTLPALQALLADNPTGDISEQDVRDFLVTVFPRAAREFDAIVDAGDANPAGVAIIYQTIQAAITAGHSSIFVRRAADAADITIAGGDAVTRIVGHTAIATEIPVNIVCNKSDVVFENLMFYNSGAGVGTSLTLAGARDQAFACAFRDFLASGSALLNGAITNTATSIPFDTGINGGLGGGLYTRGYAKCENEVLSWSSFSAGNSIAGTLSAGTGRGRIETLNEAHADNTPIYDLSVGHLVVNAPDCQAIQCRFIACSNPNAQCILVRKAGDRVRLTSNVFLANSTWSATVMYPEGSTATVFGPVAPQIVSNVYDSNNTYSGTFECWNDDNSLTLGDIQGMALAGNLFRQLDGGALRIFARALNSAGNSFDGTGTTQNTQQMLVNNGAGVLIGDTTITYDTVTGNGNLPSKGVVLIDTEWIAYSAKTATQLLGCIRGFNGSTAAAHADNAPIKNYSQRAFWCVGGASVMGLVINLITGNSFAKVRAICDVQSSALNNQTRAAWATNIFANCEIMFLGNNYALSDNVWSGTGSIDVRSAISCVIFGGYLNNVTFLNVSTDTVVFVPAGGAPTGVPSNLGIPGGRTIALGRIAGDVAPFTVPMTNRTGALSVVGNVAELDVGNPNSFVQNLGANSLLVCGVVMSAAANLSDAQIAVSGVVNVLCTGTVAIGDRLVTDAAAGVAKTNNAPAVGAVIGKAMSAGVFGAGTGLIKCVLGAS